MSDADVEAMATILAALWPSVFILIVLLISIPVAIKMNRSLHRKHPDLRPYVWGYIYGLIGLTTTSILFVVFIVADIGLDWAIVSAIMAVTSFLIIKRNRWAWIIGTIISLNPIVWVTNGIYIANRWGEMRTKVEKPALTISTFVRVFLASSFFWALFVLAIIFMFDPYYSIDGEAIWSIMKLIFTPPVVAAIGYGLYSKFIKTTRSS